jgi:hypothetical protein
MILNFNLHPVNRDDPIGTDNGTIITAGTFIRVFHVGKMITLSIDLTLHPEYIGGTYPYAEFTAFAMFNIDNDRSPLFGHMNFLSNGLNLSKILILNQSHKKSR